MILKDKCFVGQMDAVLCEMQDWRSRHTVTIRKETMIKIEQVVLHEGGEIVLELRDRVFLYIQYEIQYEEQTSTD